LKKEKQLELDYYSSFLFFWKLETKRKTNIERG